MTIVIDSFLKLIIIAIFVISVIIYFILIKNNDWQIDISSELNRSTERNSKHIRLICLMMLILAGFQTYFAHNLLITRYAVLSAINNILACIVWVLIGFTYYRKISLFFLFIFSGIGFCLLIMSSMVYSPLAEVYNINLPDIHYTTLYFLFSTMTILGTAIAGIFISNKQKLKYYMVILMYLFIVLIIVPYFISIFYSLTNYAINFNTFLSGFAGLIIWIISLLAFINLLGNPIQENIRPKDSRMNLIQYIYMPLFISGFLCLYNYFIIPILLNLVYYL